MTDEPEALSAASSSAPRPQPPASDGSEPRRPLPVSDGSEPRPLPVSDGPEPRRPLPPGESDEPEREWWQEPGLPWKHKPTRTDIACLSWIGAISIYSLVMLPLRPVMLSLSPIVLGSLGYRTGLVMVGALAATGDRWWPLVLVLGSLGAAKFDWVYWWAGKLWGHGLIEVWSGRSECARRRNDRAVRFAHRYETLAILLTYLPLPLPAAVVYAALGAAGTRLRKFLVVDLIGALVSTAGYLYLGYAIGEPAVDLVNKYAQWLWYLSLALLAGVLFYSFRKPRAARPSDPRAST